MDVHAFLFTAQEWLGEGKISLSLVDEDLKFLTRWKIGAFDSSGVLACTQEVQIQGVPEAVLNHFTISEVNQGKFKVVLENEALGKVEGTGFVTDKLVAWELRSQGASLEGFEVYELMPEGGYRMSAQYATDESLRTQIQGRVWIPATKR